MLTWLRVLGSRIMGVVGSRRVDDDFDRELKSHLEMLTEENLRRGMEPEEARRVASLRLGGVSQIKEIHHEHRGLPAYAGEGLFEGRAVVRLPTRSGRRPT